jgi:outer membrane receptor protein involved in Fe transport
VTTLNAAVKFSKGVDSPWSFTVGVNNATDETYPIAGNSSLTTGSGYAESPMHDHSNGSRAFSMTSRAMLK